MASFLSYASFYISFDKAFLHFHCEFIKIANVDNVSRNLVLNNTELVTQATYLCGRKQTRTDIVLMHVSPYKNT